MAKKTVLKLHSSGHWYVRVRRKFYYFGKDREEAERRWQEDGPYIIKGLPVPKSDDAPTLEELANKYRKIAKSGWLGVTWGSALSMVPSLHSRP